jgi:hypothetical protein
VFLALLVTGGGALQAQTLSPGPLSRAHAALDDTGSCGRCHTTGRAVGEGLCLACHDVTARDLRAKRGLHYELITRSGRRCEQCHREHHGRDYDLVRFGAQVPGFEHGQTGFPLTGRHAELTCAPCHRGKHRYQGLRPRCASCHEDRHGGQLTGAAAGRAGGGDCDRCHGTTAFRPASRFDHDRSGYPLTGRHRDVACAQCHPPRGADDRQWTGRPHGACTDCHGDPHRGEMTGACTDCHTTAGWAKVAALAPWAHAAGRFPLEGGHAKPACAACHGARLDRAVSPHCASCHRDPHAGRFGADCARCHTVDSWEGIAAEAALDHAPGRFPLTGKHRRLACAACHGAAMEKKVSVECASCHAEPHAGRFGAACADCHDAAAWRLRPGAAFSHDRTDWPLAGAHRRVACQRCHPPSRGDYRRRYAELAFGRCRDCHEDVHGRTFASVAEGERCESCHTVEAFVPATYGRAEHARAAFPLDGAHRAVPCARCHRPEGARAVHLALPAHACKDCHEDVHRGTFDARMGPRGCATCHGTTSWKGTDFDHATTRFPLTGRHAEVACTACHGTPEGGAHARFTGLDRRCEACHPDAHFGQFAITSTETRAADATGAGAADGEGARAARRAKGCGDCHGTATFRLPAPDHAALAGWPLEGAHATVPCARCHVPVALPGGGETRLYRPLDPDCAACHADPHNAAGGLGAFACADCHQPAGWSQLRGGTAFDHERTGFPLTGRHRQVACERCHGGTARPAGRAAAPPDDLRECADCHRDPHQGRQGAACDACHTTRDWSLSPQLRAHDGTRFPLVGAHRTADCVACHAGQEPERYRQTPRACFACHAEDFARPGNHPDHVAAGFPARCEQCHRQLAWQGARVTHDWWPLTGAHRAVDCAGCHAGGRYAGTPTACVGCHRDDYEATTEPAHAAAGFPLDCTQCHGGVAWRPADASWHTRFFPIRGGHRGLACADCHPAGALRGFTCTACHEHRGAEMDDEHDEVRGYVWQDSACFSCHRSGGG